MTRKALVGLGLAVVTASVILVSLWWLESQTRPDSEPVDARVRSVVSPGSNTTDLPGQRPLLSSGDVANELPSDAPVVADSVSKLPTVGDVLAEPDENYVRVAKKLTAITVDPRAPMEEREEALAHALNLSAGNEAEVLTPLIKDANLPDALAETVLAEALNRPLSYQADLYLAALAARKSPELQMQIREHLAFLTGGDDLGPDPASWANAIKTAKASWPE